MDILHIFPERRREEGKERGKGKKAFFSSFLSHSLLFSLRKITANPYAPAYTPGTVMEMIAGDGVRANTKTISDLGKTVQDMNNLMKQLQETQTQ